MASRENRFRVIVESPRGSLLKLKYDPSLEAMTLSRPLPMGLAYPFDWGFISGTQASDGDPLDALVYWDVAAVPGLQLECRAIGVIELTQQSEKGRVRNDRLVTVPIQAERQRNLAHFRDLSPQLRAEMEHFFVSSVFFTSKNPKILGWRGPREALKLIDESRE
jgi:inorganic pyrophosphatase